uniref:Ig-like domain-containing protein n=1 Tax=Anas platyrhynchos platyrhynchos TaxID=8840 RepID=A0A493TML4_ANAPP
MLPSSSSSSSLGWTAAPGGGPAARPRVVPAQPVTFCFVPRAPLRPCPGAAPAGDRHPGGLGAALPSAAPRQQGEGDRVEDQAFNLSVYESVPNPRTRSQLLASTVEWCNLTLQCQGAGKGAVNVTWRRDNGRRELGTDRTQLSPDGTTLRLALQPGTANATYACTVSNPADHKVVLFDLQSICRSGGGQAAFSKSGYIVLTLILLAVSLGGAFWCWRLNSEKSADPAATPTVPAEEGPPDPQYAEIVRRSPPEGNDQGLRPPENNPDPSPPEKEPVSTVCEQIRRAPEDAAEEVT